MTQQICQQPGVALAPESLGDDQPVAITWLNMSGDVTITWDDTNKEAIIALVREKMAQGYSFFILKPRALKVFGNSKKRLTDPAQLDTACGVVVPDSQVQAIVDGLGDKEVQATVRGGSARLASAPNVVSLDTVRRAKSAEDVVKHQSVAVRPLVGG